MNQKIARITVLPLIILFGLAACGPGGPGGKRGADKDEEKEVSVPVETALVKRGDVSAAYSGTATLESEQDAEVVARVSGLVEEIFVEQGDTVVAGQVLARLDDDRLRLEVQRAEANLRKLEQEYQRNKELYERQLVSGEAYERLSYDVESMRADLELARLQLQYTEIRAPFDGLVAERFIKIGNLVQQNAITFRVTDYDPLLAKLYVPERELFKLKDGQLSQIRVDSLPDQVFQGEIDRVSPVVDATTGTFTVTVAVSDEQRLLKPGMFGRVNIIYDVHQDAVLAPRNAILTEDAKQSVFIVNDGTATMRTVKTGYINNGSIEILEGLEPGDEIVTVGQNALKDGAKVAVIGESMPQNDPAGAEEAETKVASAD
ncbi:MAG: efflux RND transporter periplasmic adaptor subunit [Gammaproteobacteria bacterium]|nr:efflux RND transporter periplasmic adaptor subunit [Gammaproteobacteria bacterium]